jgi:microcystin-dependent protein
MTRYISRGSPIEPVFLNNIVVAARGWGVVTGLAVSERGAGANMSVDVALGTAYINGTNLSKGSTTNVVVTAADATYDRYDLVVINSSGTITIIAGTAGAVSYANDYDLDANNAILLAEVYVPAADTAISDSQITSQIIIREDSTPTGAITGFGGTTAPTGYLMCDGTAVSRAAYADLFSVISTGYGVGDGTTTFNVPDMQGNVAVGIGASGITSLGDTGGEQTHTLITSEMPAHTHTDTLDLYALEVGAGRAFGTSGSAQGTSAITSDSTGGDGAHQNMMPYVGVNFIIKT